MAGGADEATFLAIMRAAVGVDLDARGKRHGFADGVGINIAIEINPFAAIERPGFAAKGFGNAARDDGLFERLQVLAGHRTSNWFCEVVYRAWTKTV